MVNITPVAKSKALSKAIRKPIPKGAIKNSPIARKPTPARKPIPPGAIKNSPKPAKPAKPTPIRISPIEKPGKAVPMDTPDAINRYLTNDVAYQQQQAAINKAMGDYSANRLQAENQYNTQYGQNVYDLDQQKDRSFTEQENDFAGRGFYRSGGHAVADSERRNDYASKQSSMDMQRGAYLQNLKSDETNFGSAQALASQQARQDAINRRALGLLGGG